MGFFSREPKIVGDKRQECLAYYEEEKKLQLLLERVGRLFDKNLGKYEDEYFKARKSWRKHGIDDDHPDPMDVMVKIFEVQEYFSEAASEIVRRKQEMKVTPPPASSMSAAWEDVYSDYVASKDPSNIAAGYNSIEVQAKQARQKELVKKLNNSWRKAQEAEREFCKNLQISKAEVQRITDNTVRAVATDEWLRKLEIECP